MLGPGFRFHPTDEELVGYYLRRKIFGKALRFDAISVVDIYKTEPWDLPYMSKLKTRDLEWYFFSLLDKKYGNGARTNRATEKGYWKTTGKDRAVYHKTQIVGMKKTLVYHCGRAPKGQRSNWVMHEYKLADSELETAGISQDTFVLCRVFQKSGSGPKNGEQYGAPFVEEDWDANELELAPQAGAIQEVEFGLDSRDIEQILASDVLLNACPIPKYPDVSYVEETTESFDSIRNQLVPSNYNQCVEPKQFHDKILYSLPGDSEVLDYLRDEPFLDSFDNLSNPVDIDTTALDMLEEYLTFFDPDDDTSQYIAHDSQYIAHDPAMMFGSEDLVSHQASLTYKEMVEGTESADLPGGQLVGSDNRNTTSSSDKQEKATYHPDSHHEFVKRASQMLGGITAPPALAAEFPSEDVVIRLNSILPFSNSVPVSNSHRHDNFNIIVCFGFSRGDDGSSSLDTSVSILPGKTTASVFRCWLCFLFFWVLILSMGFRIGTYIYSN